MAKENKKTNKRKVATSVAAAAVALAMLIGGGSYAYLSQETGDITNNFNPNHNEVSITETGTDEDGNKTYEIIPGTTADKDPKVTATSTVASFLYVEVTDNTVKNNVKLVTYEIADGWTELEELRDGNKKVYYREIEGSDEEQSFDILKGNSVSYDSSLTNDNLKNQSDIYLKFTAKIMQKVKTSEQKEDGTYEDVPYDPADAYKVAFDASVDDWDDGGSFDFDFS